MDLGRFRVAEERVVATHIIIIDWLTEQRDWSLEQEFLCLESFAELVQTKTGVKKSRRAMWRNSTQLAANAQGAPPFLFPHQMMEAELQNLRLILPRPVDRLQFGHGLAVHAEFGITGGRPQSPFVVHE